MQDSVALAIMSNGGVFYKGGASGQKQLPSDSDTSCQFYDITAKIGHPVIHASTSQNMTIFVTADGKLLAAGEKLVKFVHGEEGWEEKAKELYPMTLPGGTKATRVWIVEDKDKENFVIFAELSDSTDKKTLYSLGKGEILGQGEIKECSKFELVNMPDNISTFVTIKGHKDKVVAVDAQDQLYGWGNNTNSIFGFVTELIKSFPTYPTHDYLST
jgi:alpha-tubulin suppressor-like RCC1 family protein